MEQNEESRRLQESHTDPPKQRHVGRTILIIVIALVIVAAIVAAIYGMAANPPITATIRDIMIIVLALVTIIIGLFLAILIFQLQSLISLLRNDIKPILDSANKTVSTVRGTTTFMSEKVVTPVIGIMSFASGIGQTARLLVRGPNGRSRKRHSHNRS